MNSSALLDSHVFLWLLQEPQKVGPRAKELLGAAPVNFVSLATIWELGIKHQKGKLAFSAAQLLSTLDQLGADLLNISEFHTVASTSLDIMHKDPFDKLLIAQAAQENLILLTADREMLKLALENVIDARK